MPRPILNNTVSAQYNRSSSRVTEITRTRTIPRLGSSQIYSVAIPQRHSTTIFQAISCEPLPFAKECSAKSASGWNKPRSAAACGVPYSCAMPLNVGVHTSTLNSATRQTRRARHRVNLLRTRISAGQRSFRTTCNNREMHFERCARPRTPFSSGAKYPCSDEASRIPFRGWLLFVSWLARRVPTHGAARPISQYYGNPRGWFHVVAVVGSAGALYEEL